MTNSRRKSKPVRRLHAILAAGWKFQTVPTMAINRSKAVEMRWAQLLDVKSAAYGLVANIISLPVLMLLLDQTVPTFAFCRPNPSAVSLPRVTPDSAIRRSLSRDILFRK